MYEMVLCVSVKCWLPNLVPYGHGLTKSTEELELERALKFRAQVGLGLKNSDLGRAGAFHN